MAKPKAQFDITPQGNRSMLFVDRSLYVPTQWAWQFGDGTVSAVQNPPLKVYAAEGVYIVQLIASNADGASDPFRYEVVARNTLGLIASIRQLVINDLPVGMEYDSLYFGQLIQKWQLFLQNAINPVISDADVFTEWKWPPLVNQLIAKLIIHDLILQAAEGAMSSLASASSQSGIVTTGNSKGPIKRMETGPSVIEWYNGSEFWTNMFKGADAGGIFNQLLNEICLYANRVGVSLPMCALRKVRIFEVVKK